MGHGRRRAWIYRMCHTDALIIEVIISVITTCSQRGIVELYNLLHARFIRSGALHAYSPCVALIINTLYNHFASNLYHVINNSFCGKHFCHYVHTVALGDGSKIKRYPIISL